MAKKTTLENRFPGVDPETMRLIRRIERVATERYCEEECAAARLILADEPTDGLLPEWQALARLREEISWRGMQAHILLVWSVLTDEWVILPEDEKNKRMRGGHVPTQEERHWDKGAARYLKAGVHHEG